MSAEISPWSKRAVPLFASFLILFAVSPGVVATGGGIAYAAPAPPRPPPPPVRPAFNAAARPPPAIRPALNSAARPAPAPIRPAFKAAANPGARRPPPPPPRKHAAGPVRQPPPTTRGWVGSRELRAQQSPSPNRNSGINAPSIRPSFNVVGANYRNSLSANYQRAAQGPMKKRRGTYDQLNHDHPGP